MSKAREIVVLSAVRTAIGDYAGALKDQPPADLAAACVAEAVARAGIEPGEVGHVRVRQRDPHRSADMYLGRVAAIKRRLAGRDARDDAEPAVRQRPAGDRLGGADDQLGDADIAVAGGAESMSRCALLAARRMRWGQRMGDAQDDRHDGRRAHRSVRQHATWASPRRTWPTSRSITRAEQDAFAVESHRRAAHAIDNGYFKAQILPVEHQDAKRARSTSTPTSTCAATPRWRRWRSCARPSIRTARSPPATRRASTTPPRPSC